jgi:hypothetical protein
MLYEYLDNVLETLIDELEGTADNEEIWMKGSPDEDTAQMHEDNCDTYRRIAEIFKRVKANIPVFVEKYGD